MPWDPDQPTGHSHFGYPASQTRTRTQCLSEKVTATLGIAAKRLCLAKGTPPGERGSHLFGQALSETVLVLILDASRSRRAGSTWLTPRHPIRARFALVASTAAWFIFAGHCSAQTAQERVAGPARAWALSTTDCALNAAQFRCEPVAGLKDDPGVPGAFTRMPLYSAWERRLEEHE